MKLASSCFIAAVLLLCGGAATQAKTECLPPERLFLVVKQAHQDFAYSPSKRAATVTLQLRYREKVLLAEGRGQAGRNLPREYDPSRVAYYAAVASAQAALIRQLDGGECSH